MQGKVNTKDMARTEQVGEDDEAKRTRRGDKERLMCQRKERWKSEGREGGRIMTGE